MSSKQTPAVQQDPTVEKIKAVIAPEDAAIVDFDAASEAIPAKLTDADIVDMGQMTLDFEDSSVDRGSDQQTTADAGDPAEESPAVEPPADAPSKVYKVGKKTFDSVEAMAEHIEVLEREQIKRDAYQKGVVDAVTPTEVTPPELDLSELMFENPKRYHEELEKRLESKLEAKNRIIENEKAITVAREKRWKEFYSENTDLEGFEEIVQAQTQKLIEEGKAELDIHEGMKLVASRTRDKLAVMRKKLLPTEDLASTKAITSGSTRADVPRVAIPTKHTSFIDEVNTIRRRG